MLFHFYLTVNDSYVVSTEELLLLDVRCASLNGETVKYMSNIYVANWQIWKGTVHSFSRNETVIC